MSRVFAYRRVSTLDQATANRRQVIEAAGFTFEPHRVIEECISGSVASSERPGFRRLIQTICLYYFYLCTKALLFRKMVAANREYAQC